MCAAVSCPRSPGRRLLDAQAQLEVDCDLIGPHRRQGSVKIDGQPYAVRWWQAPLGETESGEGSSEEVPAQEVVLALHGFSCSSADWASALRRLKPKQATLFVALDWPGHALTAFEDNSDPEESSSSPTLNKEFPVASGTSGLKPLVDFARAFICQHIRPHLEKIQSIQGNTVSIFGHSLGGLVGLQYAALFPTEVSSVLVVDCFLTKFQWGGALAAILDTAEDDVAFVRRCEMEKQTRPSKTRSNFLSGETEKKDSSGLSEAAEERGLAWLRESFLPASAVDGGSPRCWLSLTRGTERRWMWFLARGLVDEVFGNIPKTEDGVAFRWSISDAVRELGEKGVLRFVAGDQNEHFMGPTYELVRRAGLMVEVVEGAGHFVMIDREEEFWKKVELGERV
ncbi:unnamed protein product [Polarella glacialis]|uniref:AB hydrolase-1 domain-containing protein n=1 Tax=Polarella glacialis TaxID=89957 RepID=A0A813GPJ4_POLGL|nr:unnamed protein product [Polarella glacialis]CAE8680060.1 unnamed protein product [Polarella glacialis]